MEEHQKELLGKYYQGTCSQEELSRLYQYLRTSRSDNAYQKVMDQLWERISEEKVLPEEKAEAMLENVFRQKSRRIIPAYWYQVAAVFAGFVLLASVLYLQIVKKDDTLIYATRYGETKTILLPDSSQVTLNANSTLTFRHDDQQLREAWLEGEAFFEVHKMQNSRSSSESVKFVVHTTNLDVEVLGTAFNVNERRGATKVVLAHGKVRLETKNNEQITMQPGDMAELPSAGAQLIKQVVNPEDYTTWRENKLIFKRTSIEEVARIIEDYYGLEVILEGQDWDERKITGSVPTHSQEVFLEVLTESMGIEILQKGDRIVLKNSNPAATSK